MAIIIVLCDVQVQTSDPVAVLDPYSPEDGAELRQGVEGDGVVAQHACLLDPGEQEDLLYPWFDISGNCTLDICRAQSRSEYEDWLAGSVGGIRRDLDEVEEFRGRGAYVQVSA